MPKIIELETDLPGYIFRPKRKGRLPWSRLHSWQWWRLQQFYKIFGAPPRPTGKEASFVKAAQAYAQKGFVSLAFSFLISQL